MVVQEYIKENFNNKKLELCMYDKDKEEEVGILKLRENIYKLIGYCKTDKVKFVEFKDDTIMIEANIGCGIHATIENVKRCMEDEEKEISKSKLHRNKFNMTAHVGINLLYLGIATAVVICNSDKIGVDSIIKINAVLTFIFVSFVFVTRNICNTYRNWKRAGDVLAQL